MSADLERAYAPVGGEIRPVGSGRSNDRLTSIKLRVGEVTVDTHDQPMRMATNAVHQLVWHALNEPQTFPIELRVERDTVLIPVDGEPRELTLYTLGLSAAAVGEGLEVYGPLERLRELTLRTVEGDELLALLATDER
jgi:hypothetical protein